MKNSIKISPIDSVAVALENLKAGEEHEGVTLLENIEKGHKFALKEIKTGEKVIKYGEVIGRATKDIAVGEHVHSNNMMTNLEGTLEYSYNRKEIAPVEKKAAPKVNVYERENGEIGIRNEIWVIPTVGCVNSQARKIVEEFIKKHPVLEGVDGVFAYTHPYGCSQIGEDHNRTRTILQRMVKHPNAGGVLVLGLGCENNRMDVFKQTLGDYDEERTVFLIAQDVDDEISAGVALLEKLYYRAKDDKRVEKDMSCLKVGLKCGGSDGLSGITANPLVGRLSDYMVSIGGTTVLTEVPEMFGAEQLLMDRAKDEETFGKIVKLVNALRSIIRSTTSPFMRTPRPETRRAELQLLRTNRLAARRRAALRRSATFCLTVTRLLVTD